MLSLVGGCDVPDTTRAVMRKLMTNVAALGFNWSGKGTKYSFMKTNLRSVVNGMFVFLLLNGLILLGCTNRPLFAALHIWFSHFTHWYTSIWSLVHLYYNIIYNNVLRYLVFGNSNWSLYYDGSQQYRHYDWLLLGCFYWLFT